MSTDVSAGCHDFLNMLAEVASNELTHSHSQRKSVSRRTVPKKTQKRHVRRWTDYEEFDLANIQTMSSVTLLRLFSEQDFNELKRTFRYACALMPNQCSYQVQSFGNETKAKSGMKKHLQEHIRVLAAQQEESLPAFKARSVMSRRKARSFSKSCAKSRREDVKQKGTVDWDEFHKECKLIGALNILPQAWRSSKKGSKKLIDFKRRSLISPALRDHDYIKNLTEKSSEDMNANDLVIQRRNQMNKKEEISGKPIDGILSDIWKSDPQRMFSKSLEDLKAYRSTNDSFPCQICSPPVFFPSYTSVCDHLKSHDDFKVHQIQMGRTNFCYSSDFNPHETSHSNSSVEKNLVHTCSLETKYHGKSLFESHRKTSFNDEHIKDFSNASSQRISYNSSLREKREFKENVSNKDHDYDDEVAKISLDFDAQEAILNGKIIQTRESSNSSSISSYYPSTDSEFSSPDNKKMVSLKLEEPVEFINSPPSGLAPTEAKNNSVVQNATFPSLKREKSKDLTHSKGKSAFDPIFPMRNNLGQKTNDFQANRIKESVTSGDETLLRAFSANLNGKEMILIPVEVFHSR